MSFDLWKLTSSVGRKPFEQMHQGVRKAVNIWPTLMELQADKLISYSLYIVKEFS